MTYHKSNKHPRKRFRKFFRDRNGVAAIEFAIIAPLLLLFLVVTFEIGRGWLSYQHFVSIVDNTARWSARFPMFEPRIRSGIPVFIKQIAAPLETEGLDLTLRSATRIGSGGKLAFEPYAFFGKVDNIDWQSILLQDNFNFGESAIIVSGKYSSKPIFSVLGYQEINFKYSIAVNPFYSRKYGYSATKTDWDYWNVR